MKSSIYEFTDFRSFLRELASGERLMTVDQLAELSKVGSGRLMRMVLQGKRNLTLANLHAIARCLKLSFDETRYFEALVHGDQADLTSVKKHYQEVAISLRRKKPTSSSGSSKRLDFLTDLYTPAVTLLLNNKVFSERLLKDVASALGIELIRAKKAFQLAKDNGLLLQDKSNYLTMTASHLVLADTKLHTPAIQEYLKRHLKLAEQALETQYSTGGKFFSNTVTLNKEAYELFVSKLRIFFEEITAFSDRNAGDEIIQINLQAFKISKS